MGWKAALILLAALLVLPACWAQTPSATHSDTNIADSANGGGNDDAVATIKAEVQEVNVIFTATDKKGHYRKDLRQTDLAILDDGKPPAALRSFSSETDLPLRVGLLIDESGSVTERFAFEQASAIKFFNEVLRPKTDKAFVLGFSALSQITQDFTDDKEALAKGVHDLRLGGGTAVFDAIQLAAMEKLANVHADQPVRRVIIIITDGEDNQSRVTKAEAIEAAKRAGVTVYAISTNDGNTRSRGDKMLQYFAEQTGGRAFFPSKVEDVAHAFQTIQDELRSQYAVSYKPADFVSDGRYRSIRIVAMNDKNVVIRARKGYFAPK